MQLLHMLQLHVIEVFADCFRGRHDRGNDFQHQSVVAEKNKKKHNTRLRCVNKQKTISVHMKLAGFQVAPLHLPRPHLPRPTRSKFQHRRRDTWAVNSASMSSCERSELAHSKCTWLHRSFGYLGEPLTRQSC